MWIQTLLQFNLKTETWKPSLIWYKKSQIQIFGLDKEIEANGCCRPHGKEGYRLHKIWDSILWHMKIVYLFLLDRNMVGRSHRPHFNIPLLPRLKQLSWNKTLLLFSMLFYRNHEIILLILIYAYLCFESIYSCI